MCGIEFQLPVLLTLLYLLIILHHQPFHPSSSSWYHTVIIRKTSQNNKTIISATLELARTADNKLEAEHSIECINHACHSIAFLHFLTMQTCPFDLILIVRRGIMMNYLCAKFGDFIFSRSGFIVQTDRQNQIRR